MDETIKGELTIDHSRGVIWFNSNRGMCVLRICRLGPIPKGTVSIDVTHKVGVHFERDLGMENVNR